MKYQIISPEEFESQLKENNDIILIDVRSKEEYEKKHIPKAIIIPLDTLTDEISDKVKDKNKTIFLYCRTGRRSKIAAEKIANLGYNHIYILDGGINNWKYETE